MSAFELFFGYLLFAIFLVCNVELYSTSGVTNMLHDQGNAYNQTKALDSEKLHSKNRKLMAHGMCTNRDISISQSKDSSSGIPQYIVLVVNTCESGCAPSNIHLHCGWFASARIVNPHLFKRLSYDDCLVNQGRPLKTNQIIRFTYSNSFSYPLTFKYATFC